MWQACDVHVTPMWHACDVHVLLLAVVLVYDFHPASKTMKEAHLKHSKRMCKFYFQNQMHKNTSPLTGPASPPPPPPRPHPTAPLPEDLVWEYIVQLASALRLIHGNHLALRCLDPSKILVTGPRRLRISCAGIVDILTFDAVSPPQPPAMHQVRPRPVSSLVSIPSHSPPSLPPSSSKVTYSPWVR